MSKKLRINKDIIIRGNIYQVYVNGRFYNFKSRRKAEDFIRAVDNYINTQFEMVNANLISVYGTYRRLSWYIHPYDRTSIRLQINEIEQAIELSIDRSDWSSWRNTIFAKLDYSIELLGHILGRMQDISKQKKYTVLSGEIRSNSAAVELLKIEVQRFETKNKKHLAERLQVVHKKIINFK
tara:strand:- start:34 stop:576 length:543 start_codon:yes stop_codon:yes gene_type:complete